VPEPLGPLRARSLPVLALVMAYSRALEKAARRGVTLEPQVSGNPGQLKLLLDETEK